MAIELSEQVPHFWDNYLNTPAFALPKGAQWIVDFNGLKDVQPAIIKTAQLEPNKWVIERGLSLLANKNEPGKGYKGCLFCQAVSIPGESSIANPEGIQKNQFLGTTMGDGRGYYSPTGLRMTFLETNISFVENVLRPWVVTTARLGMLARDPASNDNYRQDITVYKLGTKRKSTTPFILQQFDFFGACPVEISNEEYNYYPATAPVLREATFVFNSYKLNTQKNNRALD